MSEEEMDQCLTDIEGELFAWYWQDDLLPYIYYCRPEMKALLELHADNL